MAETQFKTDACMDGLMDGQYYFNVPPEVHLGGI